MINPLSARNNKLMMIEKTAKSAGCFLLILKIVWMNAKQKITQSKRYGTTSAV
jgi:hypothetical protein